MSDHSLDYGTYSEGLDVIGGIGIPGSKVTERWRMIPLLEVSATTHPCTTLLLSGLLKVPQNPTYRPCTEHGLGIDDRCRRVSEQMINVAPLEASPLTVLQSVSAGVEYVTPEEQRWC